MDEEADAALVARCRAGDRQAYGDLVARYERPVYGLACRMLGDREAARDAAQAAFLRALEHLDRFDAKRRFFSWIYRIAVNECLDVLARRGRHTELDDGHAADDDPERDAADAEASVAVRRALDGLSPEHRAVIVLRHFRDLGYEEIAEVLSLSGATVKSRLYEARGRLRAVLAPPPRAA